MYSSYCRKCVMLQDSGSDVSMFGCPSTGATLSTITLWANAEYVRGMSVRSLLGLGGSSKPHPQIKQNNDSGANVIF
jgi:hypothetical protein